MEVSYLEILGMVLVVLMTGGISYMVHLSNRLKEVEKTKVDMTVFNEVRQDIKQILEQLINLQLENAKWEAREEMQKELKHEKF